MPTPTSPAPSHPAAAPRSPRRPHLPGLRGALRLLLSCGLALAVSASGGSPAAAQTPPPLPVPQPGVQFETAPDAASRYIGQLTCMTGETPGVTALRQLLRTTYGRANDRGGWRDCGQGGRSEHKEGRAYDWMLNAAVPADKALADGFLAWLTGPDADGVAAGNARRLGVMYVIWNHQIWQSSNGAWKPYTGSNPHTDHVHVSLSWDGAFMRTSWWTGRAVKQPDLGPCQLVVGQPYVYTGPRYGSCPAPVTRSATATGPTVHPGQTMTSGMALSAPGGGFVAVMQTDGNLVMYAPGARPVWHTRTSGNPGARLTVQTDGNVVLYSAGGRPLWHTGTHGNLGSRLAFQADGNIVVYRGDNRPLWWSGVPRL